MEDRGQRAENVQADEQSIKYFAFTYSESRNADPQRQRHDAYNAVRAGQTD